MEPCDRTVLIIDNDVCDSAETYQRLLEQNSDPSYRVITEHYNGPLLDLCRTYSVDGIILESHAPDPRGFDVLDYLSTRMGERCPPIIMIDKNDANLARQAFKGGVADYLVREQVTAYRLHQALSTAVSVASKAVPDTMASLSPSDRYRTLIESMDEGFCICEMLLNKDGAPVDYRFLEVNPVFEALTGLQYPIGKTARELVPGLEETWFEIYGNVALAREPIRFEQQSMSMQRWFDVYAFPMGEPQRHLFGILFRNITARKTMEQEREQFLAVGSDLQVITDRNGYFQWVSPTFEKVLGWTVAEATARPWTEFVHSDDVDPSVLETDSLFSGNETFAFENRYRHKDGSYRWLLWRAQLNRDQQVVYGAAIDITESKRRVANTAFLAEIAIEFSRLSSADDIMQAVGAKIGAYLNLSSCAFAEIDDAKEEVIIHYAWHADDMPDVVGTYCISDFVTDDFRQAAHNREMVVVSDTDADRRTVGKRYAALNIRSFVNVPFHKDGQWRFWLNVYDSSPHDWRDDEIALIRELANQIFPRLEHARAEAALRESEARFKGFAKNSHDVIWITDANEYRLIYVSPSFEQVWGRSATDLYANLDRFIEFVHPDDRDRIQCGWQRCTQAAFTQEYRIIRPNGTVAWIRDRGFPIYGDQGNLLWIGGIAEDISDRKWVEETLQQREAELRLVTNAVPSLISFVDAEQRYRFNNHTYEEWFGQPAAATHGRHLRDVLGEGAYKAIRPYVEQVLAGQQVTYESEVPYKDGGTRHISATYVPRFNSQGMVEGFVALVNDVSERARLDAERKQAELALRKSEERAQLAIQVARLGTWRYHLSTNLIELDERMREIWGEPTSREMIPLPQVIERIHPDDRARITHAVEAALDPNASGTYNIDYRLVWNDGNERWIAANGQVQFEGEAGSRQAVDFIGTALDITERKRAEIALREREQRLDLATNAAKLGVFEWDIQADSAIWENAQMYEIFGHTLEDGTLNKAQSMGGVIHPDDREEFEQCLSEGMKDGHFHAICRIRRHRDGEWRWVESIGQFELAADGTPRHLVGVLSDISDRKRSEAERKQAEEDLRNSAERLSLALAAAKLGDWSWDAATDMVTFSEQAAEMFGIPPGPYMTWTQMQKLLHPEDRERARVQVERAIANHSDYDIEYRVIHSNSQLRWVAAKGRAQYTPSGQVLGMLGVVQDITSRKRIEQEREQLLSSERTARAQAEAANRVKDEFLAVVSHELRSPLNPILGWSKLLLRGQLDEQKTRHALEIIERNTQIQAQLINDLLDVSRILRGKLSLNKRAVNLRIVVQAALETVHLAAEAKSIQIQTALDPELGSVSGDSDRLQQVVWNLLSNAVKFTPEGGRVEVRLEQVEGVREGWETKNVDTDSLTHLPTYAQLTISDTGKGIHPDFLPHVFDRFRQESTTTTRQFGGLGLGLALVRYLVELHGGSVQADSAGLHQGATFTVKLPLLPHNLVTNQDIERSKPSTDLNGVQILVVDDDASTREFTVFLLELNGATVVAVASAGEALSVLANVTPNILLSDIGMPDMDGYTLMRQVRSLPPERGGQMPAIALTAYAGEINYQHAMAAGFQKHIPKPIDPDQLIEAIADLVKHDDTV